MSPALIRLNDSLAAFWRQRNARERTMLTLAAAVILSALIYAMLIAPALSGRAQLEKNLPLLHQQAAEMQALSRQAAQFASPAAVSPQPLSRENIDAALARKGLKAQNVAISGNLVKLQLPSASFAAILDWLDEMQKTAGFAIVDANIVALAQPDSVSATLTLRQPRNEAE